MIYEYRVYTIREGKMERLQRLFTETVMPLFNKCNIKTVGYWEPEGGEGRKFIYMVGFENAAHRERAWRDFADDPDWKQKRAALEKEGLPWEKIESTVLVPTSFSPLQ
ncbi:MAG: NIPSNAP family protein [Dehalococcoidia bacterium]